MVQGYVHGVSSLKVDDHQLEGRPHSGIFAKLRRTEEGNARNVAIEPNVLLPITPLWGVLFGGVIFTTLAVAALHLQRRIAIRSVHLLLLFILFSSSASVFSCPPLVFIFHAVACSNSGIRKIINGEIIYSFFRLKMSTDSILTFFCGFLIFKKVQFFYLQLATQNTVTP